MKSALLSLAGLLLGSLTIFTIEQLGHILVKAPEGFDLSTKKGLIEAMPFMGIWHFMVPFLGHAIGTFVGAYFVCKLKVDQPLIKSMAIGFAFLAGGVLMVVMLPQTPLWFILLDLIVAYLPMAYLGYKLGTRKSIQ